MKTRDDVTTMSLSWVHEMEAGGTLPPCTQNCSTVSPSSTVMLSGLEMNKFRMTAGGRNGSV